MCGADPLQGPHLGLWQCVVIVVTRNVVPLVVQRFY
jgi:hypothetical protein